jgi:hypothetical protein
MSGANPARQSRPAPMIGSSADRRTNLSFKPQTLCQIFGAKVWQEKMQYWRCVTVLLNFYNAIARLLRAAIKCPKTEQNISSYL